MAHGTHCNCMICTIGKKIGIICQEPIRDHHDHNNTCGDHCDDVKNRQDNKLNNLIMNNQTPDKKYVCASCDSEAIAVAGNCCGAERKEKKTSPAESGSSCGCN